MVKNRLQWWAEQNNLLPVSQHGFRKGHSCSDNLSNLTLKVEEAFVEKKEVLAAFLDVRGAFDNVKIDILLNKLASIGCPEKLLIFIKFITYERLIYSDSCPNNPRLATKGVPQGGVLSPLLYILYVSSITENLQKSVEVSQFADDIAIYIKFTSLKRAKSIIQKAIQIIENNLKKLGLELAPEKTDLIHFNNNKILPGETVIEVGPNTIKSSKSVRFLGIIFDYKLSFFRQIDSVHKRCSKALNIIKFLCGTWWGADPTTLLTFYKSFARSIIDFGSFIYFPSRKSAVDKLEKLQFSALRKALGLRVSTPKNILIAESKISLEHRAFYLSNCFLAKTFSCHDSQTFKSVKRFYYINKKHSKKPKKIISQSIINSMELIGKIINKGKTHLYCHNFRDQIINISVNTEFGEKLKHSSDPNKQVADFIRENSALALYTDGSKTSHGVGTACVALENHFEVKRRINSLSSVYTAECIALSDSLDVTTNSEHSNIFIFSDSLSALTSLASKKLSVKTNPYILEIKTKLTNLYLTQPHKSINFFWIPSHRGIEGNEIADSVAKAATECELTDAGEVPFTDCFESFKLTCKNQTKEVIINQASSTGKNFFKNFYKEAKSPWFSKFKLKRELIVTVNRIRSDHYSLAASLYKIKVVDSPLCKCNQNPEDISHILWQCNLYNSQRLSLLANLKKLQYQLPLNIESIVANSDVNACEHILSFLKKCNINI
ncbi:uncharacterized protein LOC131672100 [Phymastichus coffea]|uniref:uncharacterized protein LOC131672100 n=1 Tax=Phymastichus coffea TaxID=108790 RepID=UPI00273A85C7|nr:uncharacterized protein LOC131672100 [Phymastichus coffea]